MNITIITGRLTRSVELKTTNNGKQNVSFTLAVNKEYGDKEADFIDCVAWNKTAELIANYCKKGSKIAITGRLATRTYKNKEEKNVKVTEVLCDKVEFLDSRGNDNQQTQQNHNQAFYDVRSADIQKDFDNSVDTFDIIDSDIQF